MGFFARLFGSTKKEEEPPPEPTSGDLRQALELLAADMGEAGTIAIATAEQTAEQMRAILAGISKERDVQNRYHKAIRKYPDVQAVLTKLLIERDNAEKENASAHDSTNDTTEAYKAARAESARRAALKYATIDLQLCLVREAKERVRHFMPAEE